MIYAVLDMLRLMRLKRYKILNTDGVFVFVCDDVGLKELVLGVQSF